jgi:hypothetical protein
MKVVINKGCSTYESTEVEHQICEKLINMGWNEQNKEFEKFEGKYLFKIGGDYDNISLRTNQLVVELVESGEMRKLVDKYKEYEEYEIDFVVVDIPDDIRWTIEETECDGSEFIREVHRIWDGERCYLSNRDIFASFEINKNGDLLNE